MKQYTTPNQTAKLIELGFEEPKTIVDKYYDFDAEDYKEVNHYSIGELIEMLPTVIDTGVGYALSIYHNRADWDISYDDCGFYHPLYSVENDELIDALYYMIVKLKEEGVI